MESNVFVQGGTVASRFAAFDDLADEFAAVVIALFAQRAVAARTPQVRFEVAVDKGAAVALAAIIRCGNR